MEKDTYEGELQKRMRKYQDSLEHSPYNRVSGIRVLARNKRTGNPTIISLGTLNEREENNE